MGRPEEKNLAEDSRRISIWWLKKHNLLGGFRNGSISWTTDGDESTKSSISVTTDTDDGFIRLNYTQTDYWTDEKRELNYTHGLVTTPCNYGGVRYWFECHLRVSGVFCGRRVGVLYKSPGSWYWGCRHCHNLAYYSQRVSHHNFLFSIMDLETKAEVLEEKIKRQKWRGRPTKKYKRLLRIYNQLNSYYPVFKA